MAREKFVLDSFAILCFLSDEAGSESVHRLLDNGKKGKCQLIMNVVNLAEVVYMVQRQEGPERASEVVTLLESFPMQLEVVDKSLAMIAARVKVKFPIALGDCFCAASAIKHSATVVSGDPEFKLLQDEISIQWLSKK